LPRGAACDSFLYPSAIATLVRDYVEHGAEDKLEGIAKELFISAAKCWSPRVSRICLISASTVPTPSAHLKERPAPDTLVAEARALGVAAGHAAVFEDALSGVAAGRAGGLRTSLELTVSARPGRCAMTPTDGRVWVSGQEPRRPRRRRGG
jgi:hypothetical protein